MGDIYVSRVGDRIACSVAGTGTEWLMGNPIPAIGYPKMTRYCGNVQLKDNPLGIALSTSSGQLTRGAAQHIYLWELLNETILETKVHQYAFSYLFQCISVTVSKYPQKGFVGTTSSVRCLFLYTFASILMLHKSDNRCWIHTFICGAASVLVCSLYSSEYIRWCNM